MKTFDVDFQYRFPLTDRQKITCGAGFRNVESYYSGGDQFTTWFPYPYLTTNYTSQFIQDEIAIVEDRLTLTLGCKLEQNPYTGLEYQPSARLVVDARSQAFRLGRDFSRRSHAVAHRGAIRRSTASRRLSRRLPSRLRKQRHAVRGLDGLRNRLSGTDHRAVLVGYRHVLQRVRPP